MDQSKALEIVAMVAAAYPSWRPSRETMRLYARLLIDLPANETAQAVMDLIRSEREFAPPIGFIHHAVAKLVMAASGQPILDPGEAWAVVSEAIQYCGYYREPGFKNAAIARAVKAMGWKEICANENIEATRAQFFKIFTGMQNRVLSDTASRITAIRPLIESLTGTLEAKK